MSPPLFRFFYYTLASQIVYTSATRGIAGDEAELMKTSMEPLFKAIMGLPKPVVKEASPLQVWRVVLFNRKAKDLRTSCRLSLRISWLRSDHKLPIKLGVDWGSNISHGGYLMWST